MVNNLSKKPIREKTYFLSYIIKEVYIVFDKSTTNTKLVCHLLYELKPI